MSFCAAIHNPLAINLRRQTRLLRNSIPANSQYSAALEHATTTRQLLATLSSLLAVPAYTQIVAKLYQPILLDLCARWLEDTENIEQRLIALSYLLEVHEELFSILQSFLTKFFPHGPLALVLHVASPASLDTQRLHRLLLAYYRILQVNRELPEHNYWSLEPLSRLIWASEVDNAIRLLAIRCYAMQSGMGENERNLMEGEVLGNPCGVDCDTEYGSNMDGSPKFADGWILPVIELRRVEEERRETALPGRFYELDDQGEPYEIDISDLCTLTCNVHGVLMLKSTPQTRQDSSLVPTTSSIAALRQLAIHTSLRLPTLLTSAPSAGKSLLLSHLAHLIYPEQQNQILTIHLADTSLDPRALLGSYVSSTTNPGNFEWRDGVLVRAMLHGKWVVFEDIDKGSNEVLGVLNPLIESLGPDKWIGGRARIDVPGRGQIIADDRFIIFGTRSLLPFKEGFPSPTFYGSHKFIEVQVDTPSAAELLQIVDTKFSRLAGLPSLAIVQFWTDMCTVPAPSAMRNIGLRELEKYCQRIQGMLGSDFHPMDISEEDDARPTLLQLFPNPSLREDMYLEARDVFFGSGGMSGSTEQYLKQLAAVAATHYGLDAERQAWVLDGKVPSLDVQKDVNGQTTSLPIGSTRLYAQPSSQPTPNSSRPFALHRPALLLLSRISKALTFNEPILLTGETGTGKTSVITHLASMLNYPLISLNLSHQTESSDLIGGLKPIDARIPGSALQQKFMTLFGATFSRKKNEKFSTEVRKAVNEQKWKRAAGLWKESVRLALERFQAKSAVQDSLMNEDRESKSDTPRKRRKMETPESTSITLWSNFLREVEDFEKHHVQGQGKLAFGFIEGPLIKAIRTGQWILLDEVNLASAETLECISSLLHGPTASITLTEQGALEPVPRHPDFRLFACMNPATDVGKKDLPPNIRSRFTEIDVLPPDNDKETLLAIISQYIGHIALGDKGLIMDIAEFYRAVKAVAQSRQIADGSNHRPHFSMRTLTRALTFASDTAAAYSLRRSVWEGCLMAFTMALDKESAKVVMALAQKHLLAGVRNPASMLSKIPPPPKSGDFVKFGPYYLEKGPLEEDLGEDYIMTPSVHQKLIDLARIILTRRFPVLIEGPTSSGKTSSVEYLSKRTGHKFIRINNHEHTDIQEYIGSYVSDPVTGKLVFKDGLLVQALREGSWIVLDELNLAPSDVLEALNRLLDDNRELVIPETHEVVRPHPHFMLFATQNPPGLYAGRKVLSRAFRNRFLEVHFDDVPQDELETILCQRCKIAPSYGKKIVEVFRDLQKRRQTSRIFESKQGFATLRDLFRWAGRDAVGYQELAENGYMLLAERVRNQDDKLVVKEVIQSVMNVTIDERAMYDLARPPDELYDFLGRIVPSTSHLVWTQAIKRLYVLLCRALKFNEPVLLVGETGCGKTSICQVYAEAQGQQLITLNCHQNTETADLIGGLRPLRNRAAVQANLLQEAVLVLRECGVGDASLSLDTLEKTLVGTLKGVELDEGKRARLRGIYQQLQQSQAIFEWNDGPLIYAMKDGHLFLLDEISLADDSVLERLNSVLEPSRTIVLAERGGTDSLQATIQASDPFRLVATMNPGGDYGKKELSPALRNRFTEIWVPAVEDRADLELIVQSLWKFKELERYTIPLLDFAEWLCAQLGDKSIMSIRDILAWINFMNSMHKSQDVLSDELFHHGAYMTYLDGLGALPQCSGYSSGGLAELRTKAQHALQQIVPLPKSLQMVTSPVDSGSSVNMGPFSLHKGSQDSIPPPFNFHAPTTLNNAMRLIRACQVPKPILLEGSPGVGKTSLVTALAQLAGHRLHRINLSDQTDLIDLFGSDLPVEGGAPGQFAWKDAEFLQALQEGHWILLDEMNLAPQAVLEGLNAALDHRGTVYIPELNRSFIRHPSFRIFAAQNPINQGGGRKGLPKSFVNRFSKVYVDELTAADLHLVCSQLFPSVEKEYITSMIEFNTNLNRAVSVERSFGQDGSPWEFNLRDILRWGSLMTAESNNYHPKAYFPAIYQSRFRNTSDRCAAADIFDAAFHTSIENQNPDWKISDDRVHIGHACTPRNNFMARHRPPRMLKRHLPSLESLAHSTNHSWLAILTGSRRTGKSAIVRLWANITGNPLDEISINSSTDTMDILGSFEQIDLRRSASTVIEALLINLDVDIRTRSGCRELTKSHHQIQCIRHSLQEATSDAPKLLAEALDIVTALAECIPDRFRGYQHAAESISFILSSDNASKFQWVDGPLVRAMKTGRWMLLDGANLCNPSVLDRLNSLCESNGFLTLSERGFVNGAVETIRPHPNFRLFMSVDPHYGELSRAMRNRGIEIAIDSKALADDPQILENYHRLPPLEFTKHNPLIAFDAVRRSLVPAPLSRPLSVVSSGRAIDQQVSLSSLVDEAPNLLQARYHQSALESWLLVLSRTTSPTIIPYLVRLWRSIPPPGFDEHLFRSFLEYMISRVIPLLDSGSCDMSTSLPVSVDWPLIFHLNHHLRSRLNSDSQQWAAFDRVNLAVKVFLQENQKFDISEENAGGSAAEQTIKCHIHDTLASLLSTAKSVLNDPTASSHLAAAALDNAKYLTEVSLSHPFDFSATQSLSLELSTLLSSCPEPYNQLSQLIKRLHESTSLKSGQALFTLWGTFYDAPLSDIAQSAITTANSLVETLMYSEKPLVLAVQAYLAMCVEALPAPLKIQHINEVEKIRSFSSGTTSSTATLPVTQMSDGISHRSLILELEILGGLFDKYAEKHVERALSMMIQTNIMDRSPLYRLIAYRHLIWAKGSGKAFSNNLFSAQLKLLEGLWGVRPVNDSLRGPSILLHPVVLHNVIHDCDLDTVNLSTLASREKQIRHQANLSLTSKHGQPTRMERLTDLFLTVVSAVVSALIPTMSVDSLLGSKPTRATISQIFSEAQDTIDPLVLDVARAELLPMIPESDLPTCSSLQTIADNWLSIGIFLTKIIIPDTPVDPAAFTNSTLARLRTRKEELLVQIDLHSTLEQLTTGMDENPVTQRMQVELSAIQHKLENLPDYPQRSDVQRLHLYWSEVFQFRDAVISVQKLQDLRTSILRGEADAAPREHVMQESLSAFAQRLDIAYPELSDINVLLRYSLLCIRLGYHLLAASNMGAERLGAGKMDIASGILAFPVLEGSFHLIDSLKTRSTSGSDAFQSLLLTLAAIAFQKSEGLSVVNAEVTQSLYEQAAGLWRIDRAKEKQRAIEAGSLYRPAKVDYESATDAEIEEAELKEIFPTFESLDEEEEDAQSVSRGKGIPNELVLPARIPPWVEIHLSLFNNHSSQSSFSRDNFIELQKSVLKDIISSSPETLSETLDPKSSFHQILLLRDTIQELTCKTEQSRVSYSFYHDLNITEARKLALLVQQLHSRLQRIAEEWPDQMVLQHLMERCQTVINSRATNSVAKLLSMLEQLLLQTDDWEMYANKENSIKTFRESMIRLVIEWRQLELICWRNLLRSQAIVFRKNASQWWFKLYDIIIHGTLAAKESARTDDDALGIYLRDMVLLLDDFMTKSPLGEFEARLELLDSFRHYLFSLSHSKDDIHSRVARILSSSFNRYNLLTSVVRKRIADQQAALEKEVAAFVKLASWKDTNVHALKQSAQKTHRQLYKITRKFQALLREPIPQDMETLTEINSTTVALPSSSAPLDELQDRTVHTPLQSRYQKYSDTVKTDLLRAVQSHSPELVVELVDEIISQSKLLASITIPTADEEVRVRHKKALLVRKRKAWSDLLKELKRGGLSSNLKPETLRQNMDEQWLREQPVIEESVLQGNPELSRSEHYFFRLCRLLPGLRSSIAAHHSDLTTREIQKGLMFLESGVALAIDLRGRLATLLNSSTGVASITNRMHQLAYKAANPVHGQNAREYLRSLSYLLSATCSGLNDLLLGAKAAHELDMDVVLPDGLNELIDAVSSQQRACSDILQIVAASHLSFITNRELEILSQCEKCIQDVRDYVDKSKKTHECLAFLFTPLEEWLMKQTLEPLVVTRSSSPVSSPDPKTLVDRLLVSAQLMLSSGKTHVPPDGDDEPGKYILDGFSFIREFSHLLNVTGIQSTLQDLAVGLSSSEDLLSTLENVLPFLDAYKYLMEDQVAQHICWTRGVFKLNYVLYSLLKTLCEKGFCQPPEPDDSGKGDEGKEAGAHDGVGVGEGAGEKNVSNEIEEESQVEGLQGDTEENDQEKHEDGDALEMDTDFGGKLEDVPDDGSEKADESADEEEQEDFDEALGELDDMDENAVDEKMWGDEKGPEDSDRPDQKAQDDHSQQQNDSSEVAAKEGGQKEKSKDQQMEYKDEEPPVEKEENDEVEETEESREGDDSVEDDPKANGAPMDDHVPDADTLDLPDDLQLGKEDIEMKDIRELEDDGLSDGEGEVEEMEEDSKSDSGGQEEDKIVPDTKEEPTEVPEDMQEDAATPIPQEQEEEAEDDNNPADSVAAPNLSNGDGIDMNEGNDGAEKLASSKPNNKGAHNGLDHSSDPAMDETVDEGNSKVEEDEKPTPTNTEQDSQAAGAASQGAQQGQDPSDAQTGPSPDQPRSLGDTLKEISHRFEEILNSEKNKAPEPSTAQDPQPSQVEYLHPDDTDHDMQALGPALDEKMANLNQLNIVDDDQMVEDENVVMDVDAALIPERQQLPDLVEQHRLPQANGKDQQKIEKGALLQHASQDTETPSYIEGQKTQRDIQRFQEEDEAVEQQLRTWRSAQYPDSGAEAIWRSYESLTQDLAYALCEQLRLILEPTLATRLKGDYRTGKRLNMKKVISYIASDYTKDKIWLRRTRPSQREYQVLISLDDSRSMAESHSIHLAYQTLALISKALNRLESGDIGIAKFGETVDLLHGFDEGAITNQAGTKIVNSFRFTQKATNVLSLLEQSLHILENARERKAMSSASAADLWQLQIIISDGMCQDHQKLRTILRKAEEQRVMVVFIILDSLHSAAPMSDGKTQQSSSILSMDTAEFTNVNGKMELQLRKYLDTFPFEYYVVLRDVEALPDVLSSTLKQFFERISEE
ncbi:hypothetical protein BJ165DRAFT_1527609 [Panaeolus papilionaceus]|nr:hypothetical protein BJ165DRAFT_1527609 [Panaeolus papilionaceus]